MRLQLLHEKRVLCNRKQTLLWTFCRLRQRALIIFKVMKMWNWV